MCCHYTIPTRLPVFPGCHRFEYSLLDAPKTPAITNSCFGRVVQDFLPHPTSQERTTLLGSPFLVSTENWWGRRVMAPPYPFCPHVRLPLRLSHPGLPLPRTPLHCACSTPTRQFSAAIVILCGGNRTARISRERPGNWQGRMVSNHLIPDQSRMHCRCATSL